MRYALDVRVKADYRIEFILAERDLGEHSVEITINNAEAAWVIVTPVVWSARLGDFEFGPETSPPPCGAGRPVSGAGL